MDFSLKNPCSNCPFLKEGGIRLRRSRTREIAGMMLSTQGDGFSCHATVDYENRDQSNEKHCAGALIFAEKNGTATQMMRIAERLGLYDPEALMRSASVPQVFDSLREMLAASLT